MAERRRMTESSSEVPATGWRERSTASRAHAAEAVRIRSLERATKFVHAALSLMSATLTVDFSVRQVIERAGLSRRAFYDLFESKDDLLVAVYEETIRMMVGEIEVLIAEVDDPIERLRIIVTELFLRSSTGPSVRESALLSTEYRRLGVLRPKELREAIEPSIALMRREIERAMDASLIPPDDPSVLAKILLNVASAHITTALLETSSATTGGITTDDLWKFCRQGLGVTS
jgi:AcrR family transcriptional regulator